MIWIRQLKLKFRAFSQRNIPTRLFPWVKTHLRHLTVSRIVIEKADPVTVAVTDLNILCLRNTQRYECFMQQQIEMFRAFFQR